MKNLFVTYEIAKQLKEKGFNEPCLAVYDITQGNEQTAKLHKHPADCINGDSIHPAAITAPLYQQVIDWLFEKHRICIMYSPQKNILEIDILRGIKLIKK